MQTNERQPSSAGGATGASAEAAKSLAKPLVGPEVEANDGHDEECPEVGAYDHDEECPEVGA